MRNLLNTTFDIIGSIFVVAVVGIFWLCVGAGITLYLGLLGCMAYEVVTGIWPLA